MTRREKDTSPWQQGRFAETDNDPVSGLVNIMDVMLVFALGLLITLLVQNPAMREHFKLKGGVQVQQGKELAEVPEGVEQAMAAGPEGMESLGTVYRDAETGKLILIQR